MVTKEEKIFYLKQQVTDFKNSLQNSNSFDRAIYLSNTPKKDRIRYWGETLEKIFKLEGREDELDSISTIITLELKEMGLEKAVVWARQVLPNKYKDPSQIRSKQLLSNDDTANCYVEHRQLTEEDYTRENIELIEDIEEDIKILREYTDKLRHNSLASKIDMVEYDEFRTRKRGMRILLKQLMDGRGKVLPEQLHLLMHAYSETTKSDSFSKYLKHINDVTVMTPKQTVRLLSGRVTKVELLYEPKSRPEARRSGFTGFPCDECGSWRNDLKYNPDQARNMFYCWACKEWTERKSEPLLNQQI